MKSNLFYPNRFARLTLQAMEEVIGPGGMKAIYNMANLPSLAASLPPDNMEREFDFADISQLFSTLTILFGNQGSRSLAVRAGRTTMQQGIKLSSAFLPDDTEPVSDPVTMEQQLIRLNRFSNFLNSVSDQKTSVYRLAELDGFEFSVQQCPFCWGQKHAEPICAFFEGMLDQAIKIFSNNQSYSVSETKCIASGSESCLYLLQKISEPN